eukprot:6223337-Amphidinium_carterae.1
MRAGVATHDTRSFPGRGLVLFRTSAQLNLEPTAGCRAVFSLLLGAPPREKSAPGSVSPQTNSSNQGVFSTCRPCLCRTDQQLRPKVRVAITNITAFCRWLAFEILFEQFMGLSMALGVFVWGRLVFIKGKTCAVLRTVVDINSRVAAKTR